MSWLFAPDSYGGFCTAPEALALASGQGWSGHPMSDGGEGLLAALRWHRPTLASESSLAAGPCGRPRRAERLRGPEGTFIASAQVVGPTGGHRCGALARTSAGLGRLLRGVSGPVVVGLGGSATVDGGIGALAALGLSIGPPDAVATGETLRGPLRVRGPLPDLSAIVAWCDVQTPLAESMARFGPQKGLAAAEVVAQAEAVLCWAAQLNALRAEPLPLSLPGGGAAGGLGFALAAAGATLLPGAAAFADMTGLDAAIAACDGVILGEGRLDAGSFAGKVASVVVARARAAGKGVAALVGEAEAVPPPPVGPDIVVEIGERSPAAFAAAASTLAEELR